MNIKLVYSIATIIDSLSPEERELLELKIQLNKQKKENQKTTNKVKNISLIKTQGKPFEPPLDEYIKITRDERIAEQDELINRCFASNKN